uniref:Uncharacterized protein n=1 Tax=Panagrolaimus sp. PS1159 TaxID=55785 RepID=A0AC35GQH1_9BILA
MIHLIISSEIPENTLPDDNDSAGDPQPSTIAEADRVEKMQLAKLQDRKPRIRYDPPSQCPCCGRITPASRHIA